MQRSLEQGHGDGNDEVKENVKCKGPVTTGLFLIPVRETSMSRHNEMPPVPPANRSHKGSGDNAEVSKDMAKTKAEVNTAEQGDTANIKQNTTNAGFFKGRRVK